MILNNLKNILKMATLVGGGCQDGSKKYMKSIYPIVDTSGSAMTYLSTDGTYNDDIVRTPFITTASYLSLSYKQTQTSNTYTYLVVGNGTTPVTEDDYFIESIITSGISLNSSTKTINVSLDEENNKVTKTVSIMINIKNTGTSDVTISEIGLMDVYHNTGTSTSNAQCILLHREVFNPITLGVDETKTFTFDFEFVTQIA